MTMKFTGPNPFRGTPPSPEERDKKRREKQLQLGVLWTKRKITNEKLQARKIRLSPTDIERYERVRKEQSAMKGTEEPGWAEWMLLEGADSQGGVTGGKYEWFGDGALVYNPNKIDDVLHRTDAIVMFLDEEDERKAYPVAIDAVSFSERYPDKMEKDLDRLSPRNTLMSSAYWIDTDSEAAGEAIDSPKEGIVQTVQTSVYIPAAFAEKYRDPKTNSKGADDVMRRLKPFVLLQLRIEMETELLYVMGELRIQSLVEGRVETKIKTRTELIDVLKRQTAFSGPRQTAVETLSNALNVIWKELDKSENMDPELRQELPMVLRRLDLLEDDRAKIEAAE